MVKHENHYNIPTIYHSVIINQFNFIFSLSGQKMKYNKLKSPVDGIIIDLILEHFNILSISNTKPILTDDEFDDIVERAEDIYYKSFITESPHYDENIRN